MTRAGHERTGWGVIVIALLLLVISVPSPSKAQTGAQGEQPLYQVDAFEIRMDSSILRLSMPPGGALRISGVVTYGPEGTTFDASSETRTSGRREGGLIDPVATGLRLRSSDAATHTYVYELGDLNGAVCRSAGLDSPCLVLRLPSISAERRRDLGELREDLQGALRVEVLASPAPLVLPLPLPTPQPIPQYNPPVTGGDQGTSWITMTLAGAGGGITLSFVILFFGLKRRKKSGTVEDRVKESASRLAKKIGADPVKARLKTAIKELAQEAENLSKTRKQLVAAFLRANLPALERRHAELLETAKHLEEKGGMAAGQGEMTDAAKIVEGQIDRCRQWEMQRWRSTARLERIATRLEALELELNGPKADQGSSKEELLDVLQEELDLARAGEQEAQKLLSGS